MGIVSLFQGLSVVARARMRAGVERGEGERAASPGIFYNLFTHFRLASFFRHLPLYQKNQYERIRLSQIRHSQAFAHLKKVFFIFWNVLFDGKKKKRHVYPIERATRPADVV